MFYLYCQCVHVFEEDVFGLLGMWMCMPFKHLCKCPRSSIMGNICIYTVMHHPISPLPITAILISILSHLMEIRQVSAHFSPDKLYGRREVRSDADGSYRPAPFTGFSLICHRHLINRQRCLAQTWVNTTSLVSRNNILGYSQSEHHRAYVNPVGKMRFLRICT